MLSSLRNRLILSHALPLLIIIPLMGVVIVYMFETRYLLPSWGKELAGDARLLAEITRQRTEIWENSLLAQTVLEQWHADPTKRAMFIRPDGRLLVSSDLADIDRIDQPIDNRGIAEVQNGELVTHIDHSQRLHGEVVDVFAPVMGPGDRLVGIVRISYRYATVLDELKQFRYLIAGILIVGLLSGGVLDFVLAVNIERPIQKVSEAINDLAVRGSREKLPIQGPDEIRRLVRSVNFLTERLNDLEHSRHQLLANLVHELGRPLGALRMAIQVSIAGAKRDPVLMDELLTGMDEEAARLQYLLDDLAQLHDQVLGTLELDIQPVALSDWLPKVLRTWHEAAVGKKLRWEESIAADLPTIDADPNRLAQVVGNLASNAIKYTQPGGAVSVSSGVAEQAVWIRVSDTGPGIPTEEQEKVFTPFYRGKQEPKIEHGMGLGLSIARDLAAAHRGRIQLESTPGSGSSFTIWIPISRETPI
jgi:signal transduction histidine kinase